MLTIKNKKRFILLLIISFVSVLIITLFIIFNPLIYQSVCQKRVYNDIEERIENSNIKSSCFRIFCLKQDENSIIQHDVGCGVVFKIDEEYCYALTTSHVLEIIDARYFAVPYEYQPYWSCIFSSFESILNSAENNFSEIEVEYNSIENDISIIKFKKNDDFKCITFADNDVKYLDRIVKISDPEKEFPITYGKVTSKNYVDVYNIETNISKKCLEDNAYCTKGYSGCSVLNENLELSGILIGGKTKRFNSFYRGLFIPISSTKEIINEWQQK